MSTESVTAHVRRLWAGFNHQIRADNLEPALEAWVPTLARFDDAIVGAVIDAAIASDERMPTVGEVLRRCKSGEDRRALPAGGYSAYAEYPIKQIDVMSVLREVRRISDAREGKRLEHRHHDGAERCPICGAHDHDEYGMHAKDCAWCAQLAAAATEIIEAKMGRPFSDPPTDRTSRCRACDGGGFTWSEGLNVGYPCRACRPEPYRRWAEGHMAPNHDCPECRSIREGRFTPNGVE